MASLPLLAGSALANSPAVPATYATKVDAEAAAINCFGCTGAHRWVAR